MIRNELQWVDVSFVRGKFKLSAPAYDNTAYEITSDEEGYKLGIYGDDTTVQIPYNFVTVDDAKEFAEDDFKIVKQLLIKRGLNGRLC